MSSRECDPLEPIRVLSPATGKPIGEVPDAGPSGMEQAILKGKKAAESWGRLPIRERAEALRRFRDAVLDEPRVVTTLVLESGKPRHEAEGIEILYLCELIRFLCSSARRALKPEILRPFLLKTKRTRVLRKPLGIVGVIGPWNFPILNNAADAMAPLIAGNAVVLKPSEVTPLTSVLLGELWLRAGNPEGVFQTVTGRGPAGARLVDLADGIIFTGSVATGRRVASRCGERLIPCVAELGGKSPFIVLAGADLERAAQAAVWSSFVHSGQACIRTERIYVEEKVAPEFERRFLEKVATLRHANPARPGAEHDLGSVTFSRQIEILRKQLDEAVGKGAHLAHGGQAVSDLGESYFLPTVLLGATQDMDVMREETFGPLVAIMRVRDACDAIRLANDSQLGLNATVFGPERQARQVAEKLQSGIAIVNDALMHYLVVEAPLGGVKASGIGARHGIESIRQWTSAESVTSCFRPLAPVERFLARHLGFPYNRRALEMLRRATRILYGRGFRRKFGKIPQ